MHVLTIGNMCMHRLPAALSAHPALLSRAVQVCDLQKLWNLGAHHTP